MTTTRKTLKMHFPVAFGSCGIIKFSPSAWSQTQLPQISPAANSIEGILRELGDLHLVCGNWPDLDNEGLTEGQILESIQLADENRQLQLLFYIHEVNTIKPFLPKETVIMSFMRKCHLSISVVSCPQKLFIQVLGGYSPRQIHLFIYHLRASRQIKPVCIITGKFDLLETLLSHCKHKLTKQNLHLSCVFKNNLTHESQP